MFRLLFDIDGSFALVLVSFLTHVIKIGFVCGMTNSKHGNRGGLHGIKMGGFRQLASWSAGRTDRIVHDKEFVVYA